MLSYLKKCFLCTDHLIGRFLIHIKISNSVKYFAVQSYDPYFHFFGIYFVSVVEIMYFGSFLIQRKNNNPVNNLTV